MSTGKKLSELPEKEKMKIAIAGASILTVLIVGVGIFGYFYGKNKTDTTNGSPIPVIDGSTLSGQKVLGAEVYNWEGTIININSDLLLINASVKNASGGINKKQIRALLNAQTKVLSWDLTTPPDPTEPTSARTIASTADLKTGQQILLQSGTDLGTNNEVVADTVTALITPQAQ